MPLTLQQAEVRIATLEAKLLELEARLNKLVQAIDSYTGSKVISDKWRELNAQT